MNAFALFLYICPFSKEFSLPLAYVKIETIVWSGNSLIKLLESRINEIRIFQDGPHFPPICDGTLQKLETYQEF